MNKSLATILGIGLLIVVLASFGFLSALGTNFNEVSPGKLYRSAQLNREDFKNYVQHYGIRSVINLRGASQARWFLDEQQQAESMGLAYSSIGLSAYREPTPEQMSQILERFKKGPYPILLHCMGGADRSGLVSALYLRLVEDKSKEEASKQLSIRYGHMPVGPTQAMDRFLEKVQAGNEW